MEFRGSCAVPFISDNANVSGTMQFANHEMLQFAISETQLERRWFVLLFWGISLSNLQNNEPAAISVFQ
jgi:hypothetical protein